MIVIPETQVEFAERINTELGKIDPTAKVAFLIHDEIEIECRESDKAAVAKRLGELVSARLLEVTDFDMDTEGFTVAGGS